MLLSPKDAVNSATEREATESVEKGGREIQQGPSALGAEELVGIWKQRLQPFARVPGI